MGNSSSKNAAFPLFQRLCNEVINESDSDFWSKLFITPNPDIDIPDLSSVIANQRGNVMYVCKLSCEYLESTWLQVTETTPSHILSTENALNFLGAVIPITIEQNLYDFFWDSKMLAYRIIKALCGLYFTVNFSLASFTESSNSQSNFVQDISKEINLHDKQYSNRRYLILKLLLSCMFEKNYSWKMLLTHDIIPCESFIYGLLNTIAIKNSGHLSLVRSALNLLDILIQVSCPDNFSECDMQFIKTMLIERKNFTNNKLVNFFQQLNDENANKILTIIENACKTLENSEGLVFLIKFLASLFSISQSYCKYIAISRHISIISSILSYKRPLNLRTCGSSLAKIFYSLSIYREFSVSLSISELNMLIQLLCKIALFPEYEFQDYFPLIFGAICNLSSYTIEIENETSIDLVNAYEYIINKEWILEKAKNHYNIFFIIQAINNLIQYQWDGSCYLIYWVIKKRESFYKILRMQINSPDEANLDDQATEGELPEDFSDEERESIDENSDVQNYNEGVDLADIVEEAKLSERRSLGESDEKSLEDSEEINSEENDDMVIELERISEGLILGLNADGPDDIVQRTSYLNTHVSAFSEDVDRRNTIQHIEIAKDQEWKPTPEWMLVWKTKLPMRVIFITVKELFSKVIEIQENGETIDSIVSYIRDITLVGLLPTPHPVYLVLDQKYW